MNAIGPAVIDSVGGQTPHSSRIINLLRRTKTCSYSLNKDIFLLFLFSIMRIMKLVRKMTHIETLIQTSTISSEVALHSQVFFCMSCLSCVSSFSSLLTFLRAQLMNKRLVIRPTRSSYQYPENRE